MTQKKLLKIPIYKKELVSLKEDSFVWFSSLASISLTMIASLLILSNWHRLPPQVPLFFSQPWGEKQLATPVKLWFLPLISFSVLSINIFLTILTFKKEVFLRRLLVATALTVSILCSVAIYKIITLII